MRFARATTPADGNSTAFCYTMRWDVNNVGNFYTLRFHVHFGALSLGAAGISSGLRMFNKLVFEQLGEFTDVPLPPLYEVNRSASLASAGNVNLRDASSPFHPYAPEFDPQSNLKALDRVYRYNNGGVTVSGALFDRVAVDAENARLSALISDLAKLTHSRWWVTPDRRLKFISRQSPGAVHDLSGSHLLQGFSSFSRSFDESDIPDIGSSLVVPDNFRYAHRNWMEDHLLGTAVKGFTANLNLEDLTELPTVGDTLLLDDPDVPDIANALLKNKYGRQFLVDQAVLDIDNETVELTATHPTV